MKKALSARQHKQIKDAHAKLAALQRQMDAVFDALVEDLGFQDYNEDWHNSSDLAGEETPNPMHWLFDTVFNGTEEELDDNINRIEAELHTCNDK